MNTAEAQHDMRSAYYAGAPGLIVSGLVWLVAGAVAALAQPTSAVIALCVGGAAIHPLAVLLCKALGRSGQHQRTNPLAALALESTGVLLLCLLLPIALSFHRMDLFFPGMLLVIGARYLTFHTLYGLKLYWLCGFTLAGAGLALAMTGAALPIPAFVGGLIELAFGLVLLRVSRK